MANCANASITVLERGGERRERESRINTTMIHVKLLGQRLQQQQLQKILLSLITILMKNMNDDYQYLCHYIILYYIIEIV